MLVDSPSDGPDKVNGSAPKTGPVGLYVVAVDSCCRDASGIFWSTVAASSVETALPILLLVDDEDKEANGFTSRPGSV